MVFNLESTLIENISAFPDTASVAVFWPSWTTYDAYDTTDIPDVILKTYAIRFSAWQVIFWAQISDL